MFFFRAKQKQKVHRFPCMGGGSVMMPVTRILTFLAQEIWRIFIISSHYLGVTAVIILVGASLNTWTKAWSYFLPHSFSATATGGICFGARNVLSQNENGLDLPCLKLEIARGKVAEKLHKKVLSLKWRPSPQTCTSGCQGWCAASARSCQAWWCAPCGWHCQSGLGAPASGSWKWIENGCYMIRSLDVNAQLKTLIIYWGWNGVELKFWIGMQGWGG